MSARRTRNEPAAKDRSENSPTFDTPERFEHICTAAFYKACERQFTPGHELEDWLAAEAEYDGRFGAGV